MRDAVRFPVELRLPLGFDPARAETWPAVAGKLEYVEGKLLFMPPSGDSQQDVVTDVVYVLRAWSAAHPEFVVGSNEAGMLLGEDVRAAGCAVWRRADLGEHTGGYRRVPPTLAVEVAGRDDDEGALLDKARWYLDHGVTCVWLVLPASREVVLVTATGTARLKSESSLPSTPALPGLEPRVAELFAQLEPA